MNPTITHMVVKDRQREIAADAARDVLIAEARREAGSSSVASSHSGATRRFRFALTALVATLWR
jgi:hypothetical protein